MNNVLSKDLKNKKLTYKSISYTGTGAGAVNGSASFDLSLKTSQPIYIEQIYVGYSIKLDDATAGFNLVNGVPVINDGKLFLLNNTAIVLHYSNPVPKPNDIQIIAGATEYNAAANESKLALAPGKVNSIDRIIVGAFGISFNTQVYRMGGASGGVFGFNGFVGLHYAIID